MRIQNTAPLFARPGLDIVVKMYSDKKIRFYDKFTSDKSTNHIFYRVATKGDFLPASEVLEGEPIDFQTFQTPYYMDLYPRKRAIGFSASQETASSDLYSIYAERGPLMVDAIERSMEYSAADFINLGTTSVLTPDGLSFFNAAHLMQTGTFTNILPGNLVLSVNSLALAKTALFTQPSHTGQPMAFAGRMKLLVHPANMDLAYRLTHPVDGRRPQSGADSDPNWGGMDVEVVQNPYFSSTTAWALVMADDRWNPMKMIERQGLRTNQQLDINHDGTLYTATKIWVPGAFDPRGAVYSAGA